MLPDFLRATGPVNGGETISLISRMGNTDKGWHWKTCHLWMRQFLDIFDAVATMPQRNVGQVKTGEDSFSK